MSSNRTSSNGGVRNLRAMFENQHAAPSSPEPRGRSPAASSLASDTDLEGRPRSKIRASFVSVEPSIGGGLASPGLGSPGLASPGFFSPSKELGAVKGTPDGINSPTAHRRQSFSLGNDQAETVLELKKTVSLEKEDRKKSLEIEETIPEQAIESRPSSRPATEIREQTSPSDMVNLGSIMKGSDFPEAEGTQQKGKAADLMAELKPVEKAVEPLAPAKEAPVKKAPAKLKRVKEVPAKEAPKAVKEVPVKEASKAVPEKTAPAVEEAKAPEKVPTEVKDQAAASSSEMPPPPPAPAVAPAKAPTEAPAEVPAEATTEAPAEIPIEAPIEATVEAPAEPVDAAAEPVDPPAEPVDAPAEPVEAPAEPVEAPAEPVEAPAEPVEASAEHVETPAEAPAEALGEAPAEAPTEPVEVPAEAPAEASAVAPTEEPKPTETISEEPKPKAPVASSAGVTHPKAKVNGASSHAPASGKAPAKASATKPPTISTKDTTKATASQSNALPKSPAVSKAPRTPITPKQAAPAASKAKAPAAQPKRTSTATATAPAASKPKAPVKDTTASTPPFKKPRPKSPTRPLKLPSHLTAPTASFAAKVDDGSAPQNLTRRPSTNSRAAPKPVAAVRKQTSRVSLPAQPAKRPDSRQSLKGPDEGFLARMMRPTASSASKTHEKVNSPPRKTAAHVKPKTGHEGLAAKGKRKLAEGAAKAKDAVSTNGDNDHHEDEAVPAEPAHVDDADTTAGHEEPDRESTPLDQTEAAPADILQTPNFEGQTIR